jgi:hypothetical protein
VARHAPPQAVRHSRVVHFGSFLANLSWNTQQRTIYCHTTLRVLRAVHDTYALKYRWCRLFRPLTTFNVRLKRAVRSVQYSRPMHNA